jgi:hypothetical protein
MRQSIVPSLPAVGPAFYGRDSKPENYYLNPLVKHSPFAAPIMSFLETSTSHLRQSPPYKKRQRQKMLSLLEMNSKSTGNNYWSHLLRMQSVGAHLESQAPDDLGGFAGGNEDFKASKFSIPPVATNKGLGGTPPQLAVLGDQKTDQTVAPRVQQFVGVMNWQKEMKDGKPLPVRPYSVDHPAAYQQQPLWPPAPPEPLFPLKNQDDRR